MPQDAKEAIDSEMEKLSGLAKESQEYQITRNYLDWLTVLPWGLHSVDTLSLRKAGDAHFGAPGLSTSVIHFRHCLSPMSWPPGFLARRIHSIDDSFMTHTEFDSRYVSMVFDV